jgi:hypothetical protein
MTTSVTAYKWRFFRAGGFDQVKLDTGADLMNLDQLDQKLWVALACPTTGIEFDARTAALIDTDKDGRIRANELIAAIQWAGTMLKNPDDLVKGGDRIALDAISDATPESRQLLASAKHILVNLGEKDATVVSLADASDANKIFANTTFNGDGVIIPESASDAATKTVMADIAALFGTVTDRSGKAGIDQAKADAFFAAAGAFDAWNQKADADVARVLPAGAGTAAASAAVKAFKAKVDDYFGRCRLAAFDPRTVALLNRSEAEYAAIAGKDLSINAGEIAGFPLAQIAAHQPLPLKTGINPAHADAMTDLVNHAIQPLLGDRAELTEADWAALQARLAVFETWNAAKTGAAVEKLGIARIREILTAGAQEKINRLIAQDQALEPQATSTANVEKLIRFVRDLHRLCLNFVNFKDLYGGGEPAVFQCGTLYLDQRSCNLCITVEDAGKHAVMAGLAGAYLAYCDCVRKGTGEKLSIVAIFSQGDDDNLMAGRNGIFYDRKGRDYDATITKILSNPISLRQAFWSPYKKLVRWIEEQIAKRAAEADTDVNANLATAAAAAPPPPAAKKTAFDPSVIALISVALGSLAAAAAGFAAFLGKFDTWQIPLVVAGVMLVISGPSLILAYIKLRKRNLGPILDANGWAVNAKAKINVPFGASLTGIAKLPAGAKVDVGDRYAEKSSLLPKLVITLFFVWWIYSYLNGAGWLYSWTNGSYGMKSAVQIQHDADAKLKAELEATKSGTAAAAAQPSSATTTNAAPAK